ncbi:MAG TPA: hypothetical protein VK174_12225 [Chitinophagales bacterium]|nr:hypothetical protein [Chitinophagales bacterium]
MKTPKIFAPVLLCLSLIMGCDKDENNETTGNYPLQIDNSWQYFTETQSGTYYSSFTSYWQVVGNATINGIPVTKVSQRDSNTTSGEIHQAYTYYSNVSDGLYGIAAENHGSAFFFKNGEENWPVLSNFSRSANEADSLFIPDTALYLLRYPIVLNEMWRSNEFGPSANTKRQWIGTETITTPAGTFNCDKLQIMLDLDNNNLADPEESTIIQHFCDKGLIQEEQFRTLVSIAGDTSYFHRITKLTQVNF